MAYTETTNIKLKKPAAGTPGADWKTYMDENFETLDTEITNRHAKDEDIVPDVSATRKIGSALKRFLDGFFSQITLGGVTRTTWPDAGSGSQSMDDVYNNGSVVNVDNTDVKYKLSSGKSFKITAADETETYLGVSQTDVRLKDCGNQKELIWYSAYGDEVTTTKTQTLSNKTLTSPAVNGVVSGGISSSSGMSLSDLMQTARETIELIDYTP